jgi:hypothetical protein
MGGYLEIARRVKEKRDSSSHLTPLQEEVEHWDEDWAFGTVQKAMRHLADRYVEGADLSVLDPWEDKVQEAYETEDIEALGTAVEGLVQAGLCEFELSRTSRRVQFLRATWSETAQQAMPMR